MEMRAYGEEYLTSAQRVMGDMLDYAVYACNMEADSFFDLFLVSEHSKQFENGNPTYVTGMTGCELARKIILESGMRTAESPDEMYLDKSPEYWAGWALAFYQWYTAKRFAMIHSAVSIQQIVMLYPALHEADPLKFVEVIDERLHQYYTDTSLKRIRKCARLSQSELSALSGVPLRQIQQFEQRQRDINKAQAGTLLRLGKVLGCNIEDLMEL